jgi:hypothetical protein
MALGRNIAVRVKACLSLRALWRGQGQGAAPVGRTDGLTAHGTTISQTSLCFGRKSSWYLTPNLGADGLVDAHTTHEQVEVSVLQQSRVELLGMDALTLPLCRPLLCCALVPSVLAAASSSSQRPSTAEFMRNQCEAAAFRSIPH